MADREITVWEQCKVCAEQMVGGPRCFDHNPTPEMREEQEKRRRCAFLGCFGYPCVVVPELGDEA